MARDLIKSTKSLEAILAKARPGGTPSRVFDGDGLYLKLFIKGGRHSWRFDYTHQAARKTLSLGLWPDLGLAAAREMAAKAREQVAQGIDPSAAKKEQHKAHVQAKETKRATERARANGEALPGSFEAVAREWSATVHVHQVSPDHCKRTLDRLAKEVFPYLGAVPIGDIEAPDLLECLQRTAKRTLVTAHFVQSACGLVFRYGVAKGLCKHDVAHDIRDALPTHVQGVQPAIVEPAAVGAMLRAIEQFQGRMVGRHPLMLSALWFLRPGELRQIEWAWIDFDAAMLKLPSGLMKRRLKDKLNGEPHLVPLSRQAIELLRELEPVSRYGRNPSKYVFPSRLSAKKPMSNSVVVAALRTLGFDEDTMTAHGFRAMARTMLAERLGYDDRIIEAQLAHTVKDANGRSYNRAEWVKQRAEMMQAWADYLDELRSGNVVRLQRKAA